MNDPRNITIGLLTFSACLLLTVLLVIRGTDTAVAGSSESRGGDYVMVVGQIEANTDMVYIIDRVTRVMNGYGVDISTHKIVRAVGATVALQPVFEGGPMGPGPLPR